MTDHLSLCLTLVCLILLGRSWWIHFKVKDGLARVMLLWGCGLLFCHLFVKACLLIAVIAGITTGPQAQTVIYLNGFFLYAIVLGQTSLQRAHAERNEDATLQSDKKELKGRRVKDKKK